MFTGGTITLHHVGSGAGTERGWKPARAIGFDESGRVRAIASVAAVAIVAALVLYFSVGPGRELTGGGSRVEFLIAPGTVHVGDSITMTISITNEESDNMTITAHNIEIYRNDQLVETNENTPTFSITTISPGQTVNLLTSTATVPSTMTLGGTSYSSVGSWRYQISIDTNYGTLTDSCTLAILSSGEEGEGSSENGSERYPEIQAAPGALNGEIRISVISGSIPAGEWQYSLSGAPGSYNWVDGNETLEAPYVDVGTYTENTRYVSLKHKSTGYVYFSDYPVMNIEMA